MRKLLRALVFVSGALFISLTLWTVAVLDSVGRFAGWSAGGAEKAAPVFHFIALLPAPDRDLFYIRLSNGMKESAERERATVQVFEYRPGEGPEGVRRLLRMIADIKPDGVALSLPVGHDYDGSIAAIADRGVPIVTLEADQPTSRRSAHIGTNSFELGKVSGAALAAHFPEGADAAISLTLPDPSFIMGFNQGARNVSGSGAGGIRLPLIRTRRDGAASGEELVRELLSTQTAVRSIVFTNARDAESAAQALVEYGRVGALTLVAVDDTPEIRKLIQTGVVYASVARKPEQAGEAAVSALRALAGGERTSAYTDPGVTLLTAETLAEGRKP